MQFIMKKFIFVFFIEFKKQLQHLQFFQSVYGGGQDGSGSSGSVLHTVPAVHGSYGS
jgi:hypothetical protein